MGIDMTTIFDKHGTTLTLIDESTGERRVYKLSEEWKSEKKESDSVWLDPGGFGYLIIESGKMHLYKFSKAWDMSTKYYGGVISEIPRNMILLSHE